MGWFGGEKDDSTTTTSRVSTAVATLPAIPGYQAGPWTIDVTHSEVSFTVRHMAVSKVRGRFGAVSGTIVTTEDPTASTVTDDIDVTTVTTFNEQRDGHQVRRLLRDRDPPHRRLRLQEPDLRRGRRRPRR